MLNGCQGPHCIACIAKRPNLKSHHIISNRYREASLQQDLQRAIGLRQLQKDLGVKENKQTVLLSEHFAAPFSAAASCEGNDIKLCMRSPYGYYEYVFTIMDYHVLACISTSVYAFCL